ncbi:hypothetical protein QBC39DRAFT_241530, partial [Podospora conica]
PVIPSGISIPHSAFSRINPAARHMSNSSPPQGTLGATPGLNSAHNTEGLGPQRQVSAVSQASLHPSGAPRSSSPQVSPPALSDNSTSPHITPDRGVSPEPVQPLTPRHRPGQQDEEDNLYDATPRQSKVPPQYRDAGSNRTSVASPTEPKTAGSFQDLGAKAAEQAQPAKTPPSPVPQAEDVAPRPVSPIIYANGDDSRPAPAAESSSKKATASMDRDLFEQAKRQQMMREQEEKIPVFIQEDPVPAPKKDDEEIPQMSATSYPGQEWNPYGDVDWED